MKYDPQSLKSIFAASVETIVKTKDVNELMKVREILTERAKLVGVHSICKHRQKIDAINQRISDLSYVS